MNACSAILHALKNKLIATPEIEAVYIEREEFDDIDPTKVPCLFIKPGTESIESHTNVEDVSTWEIIIVGVDIANTTSQTQLNNFIDVVRSKILETDKCLENDADYTQYIDNGSGITDVAITNIVQDFTELGEEDVMFGVFNMTLEIMYFSYRQ